MLPGWSGRSPTLRSRRRRTTQWAAASEGTLRTYQAWEQRVDNTRGLVSWAFRRARYSRREAPLQAANQHAGDVVEQAATEAGAGLHTTALAKAPTCRSSAVGTVAPVSSSSSHTAASWLVSSGSSWPPDSWFVASRPSAPVAARDADGRGNCTEKNGYDYRHLR